MTTFDTYLDVYQHITDLGDVYIGGIKRTGPTGVKESDVWVGFGGQNIKKFGSFADAVAGVQDLETIPLAVRNRLPKRLEDWNFHRSHPVSALDSTETGLGK